MRYHQTVTTVSYGAPPLTPKRYTAYTIEDVQVIMKGVTTSCDGTIVFNRVFGHDETKARPIVLQVLSEVERQSQWSDTLPQLCDSRWGERSKKYFQAPGCERREK
jgi:hypothetical protein